MTVIIYMGPWHFRAILVDGQLLWDGREPNQDNSSLNVMGSNHWSFFSEISYTALWTLGHFLHLIVCERIGCFITSLQVADVPVLKIITSRA